MKLIAGVNKHCGNCDKSGRKACTHDTSTSPPKELVPMCSLSNDLYNWKEKQGIVGYIPVYATRMYADGKSLWVSLPESFTEIQWDGFAIDKDDFIKVEVGNGR